MNILDRTYSRARFCIVSAPILPLPTNVSAGLWYTLARVDISPSSSSSTCGDTVILGGDIGGRIASTTA
jgi:hypothetical protein